MRPPGPVYLRSYQSSCSDHCSQCGHDVHCHYVDQAERYREGEDFDGFKISRIGVDKILFSSTCAVYGVPDQLPITEACPRRPISPYGSSKLAFEFALVKVSVHKLELDVNAFVPSGATVDRSRPSRLAT